MLKLPSMDHLPFEKRLSYQKHLRQFWLQILLPMFVAITLVITIAVLTGLAVFGEGGDAPRWAAISTIWLIIPVLVIGLIFLVVIIGLIYLLAQALKGIPPYTAKANYYVNRAASKTKQVSDMAVKPVLFLEGIVASLKTLLGITQRRL